MDYLGDSSNLALSLSVLSFHNIVGHDVPSTYDMRLTIN